MHIANRLKVIGGVAILILIAIFTRTCTLPGDKSAELYQSQCANCHMDDGSGLEGLIPPLNNAERLKQIKDQFACVVFYGKEGELRVGGASYNGNMKGMPQLSSEEIASISSYVYSTWANDRGLSVKQVNEQVANCR